MSDEQGTEVTTRRGRLSESLPIGGSAGIGRGAVGLLGQNRPEGTTTHILLLLCWGRREGWRNSLDGLGLIKEKEREKQTKMAHIVRSRGLGWPFLDWTQESPVSALDWSYCLFPVTRQFGVMLMFLG